MDFKLATAAFDMSSIEYSTTQSVNLIKHDRCHEITPWYHDSPGQLQYIMRGEKIDGTLAVVHLERVKNKAVDNAIQLEDAQSLRLPPVVEALTTWSLHIIRVKIEKPLASR
jgi:hypothetical protein